MNKPVFGNQDIDNFFYGSNEVQKIFYGNQELWSSSLGCDPFGDGSGFIYSKFNSNQEDECGATWTWYNDVQGTFSEGIEGEGISGFFDNITSARFDVTNFDTTNGYACSYWFMVPSGADDGANQTIHTFSSNSNRLRFNGTNVMTFVFQGTSSEIQYSIEFDTWYHIVSSYDPGTGFSHYVNAFYHDGKSNALENFQGFDFGAYDGVNQPFLGIIDEARLFNRPLNLEEIETLYGEFMEVQPPSQITDLQASDYQSRVPEIEITFTPSANAATHDLYRDDILIQEDITSGYKDTNVTFGVTYTYFVRAINSVGYTDSNIDTGIVTEIVLTSPIEFTEVGTFTLTAGVDFPDNQFINICVIGGGGAAQADGSGGYAGEANNHIHNYQNQETVIMTIGAGGTFSILPNPGENTLFGLYISLGGDAGDAGGFDGDGEQVITCGGTNYNGISASTFIHGGESSGAGKGGDSVIFGSGEDGERGSGGGSGGINGGAGGDGLVIITW